ncbi:hypothetical protein F5887DRAFT_968481 [Amanita rubescens]|nr:hypothetical protein F5887DRAFT_968481 [Amanita rubescens]
MNKINKDPESRSSGARTHSVVINSGHGRGSGTTKKRAVGKGGATSSITVVTTPSSSLFSEAGKSPQSWYPSPSTPVDANWFDSDVDFVHWQSSQTTNPALNSLLKEASSEELNSRLKTSPSRISPSWQRSTAKSSLPTASSSVHKSSSSGLRSSLSMAVDKHPATDRLRFRRTASGPGSSSSLTAQPQPQNRGSQGFSSPLTSGDPNQILEMMRGVSAMINENISSSTPVTKVGAKEKGKMKLASSTSAAVGRSWSSMDIDMEGVGSVQSPLNGFEKKGKGKGREADGVKNEWKRPTDESSMDADVSMADVSVTLDNPGSSDSGLKTRRREMLPPPPPIAKSKSAPRNPGSNSSSASSSARNGQAGHSALDSTCVAFASRSGGLLEEEMVDMDGGSKVPSKSEEPEIQLHPLLLEKKRLKEVKRLQGHASPVPNVPVSYNPVVSNPPAKAPLTRAASIPDTSQPFHSSQSPAPLSNASQSSRQLGLPRLGMGRSRTAPLPATPSAQPSKSSPSLPTKNVVSSKADQKKSLSKPFKPPTRVGSIVIGQGSQQNTGYNPTSYGFRQRNADHDYSMNTNRSAYPSPSPGSDDGIKEKEDEEEREIERDLRRGSTADEQFHSLCSSKQGYRTRSPPAFPPTPESVSKSGGSETEDQEEGIKSEIKGIQDQGEEMDGVEVGDPDSSFSDMAFDISIDALEETMRKYD